MLHITAIILGLLIFAAPVGADELTEAYQKEYTFLKAQKNELTSRLAGEEREQKKAESRARAQIEALQARLLTLSTENQTSQDQLVKMQESLGEVQDNSEITDGVLLQMDSSLSPYGFEALSSAEINNGEKLKQGFDFAANLIPQLSGFRKEQGAFFLKDGSKAEGEILRLGNIAAYGVSAKGLGALAPAGAGEFKLWKQEGSEETARSLASGTIPSELKIFVFENAEIEIPDPQVKTIMSTVKSGGVIGYVILGLGVLGLLLIVLRVVFLIRANSNVEKLTQTVVDKIDDCKPEDAITAIKGEKGAIARVIRAILRNLNKDRAHLEDIITESILNENNSLDRFGAFILVIAAVAPLLGLLGTVSGMISTFDIITEFGTGDPKLLSGGIAIALVTTMLGLIVAIPLLLVGNLLSGWAQSIKDDMERNALHIVNQFEKSKAKCLST
ncbi:MAG: MotA/TolQ/ExbB proton channel family protein [Thiotrichales bacterium]